MDTRSHTNIGTLYGRLTTKKKRIKGFRFQRNNCKLKKDTKNLILHKVSFIDETLRYFLLKWFNLIVNLVHQELLKLFTEIVFYYLLQNMATWSDALAVVKPTIELRVRLARHETSLSPPVKYSY